MEVGIASVDAVPHGTGGTSRLPLWCAGQPPGTPILHRRALP
jgi:hypothetical protein